MKSKRLILGFAVFALIVGYVELRLPPPVSAQGRDAVFQRLATGVLKFETPLTPTMTARLAASGTASDRTYLRGDGAWNDPLEAFRGQIAAFNGPCPSDWNEVTALRGRMIVGLVSGGTLAESVGYALTDGAVRRGGTAHTHSASGQQSGGTLSSVYLYDVSNAAFRGSGFPAGGSYVGSGGIYVSTSSNYAPPAPYVQFRYCEYQP